MTVLEQRPTTTIPVLPEIVERHGTPDPREGLTVLTGVLVALGTISLWMLLQLLFLSGFSQDRAQTDLYDRFRSDLVAMTAPLGGTIAPGTPVSVLKIPRLGLTQVVVEGTTPGELQNGPGHRRDTPLPGQVGTSVVFGRAATYGGPFRSIGDLRKGDEISVEEGLGTVTFRVTAVRHQGDPLPAYDASAAKLTLVSGSGDGTPLGALMPRRVVYVDAVLTGKPFGTPGPRLTTVPDSEGVMKTDSSRLPVLTALLAILVLLTGWIVRARRKLPASLLWMVGSPIAIALGWITTDQVSQLLPNLM